MRKARGKHKWLILREEIDRTGKIILQLNDLGDVAIEDSDIFNVNSEYSVSSTILFSPIVDSTVIELL